VIIDFHTHIFPDKLAEKAAQSIAGFYGNAPMKQCGTVAELLERQKESGIDRFVVFSAAVHPSKVQHINNFIAKSVSENSCFSGFGTLHADMDAPEAEIERIIKLNLKGVKIHPDMQGFNLDDDKMMNIYAALEGRLPVIFHCGDFRFDNSHPRRLLRVLKDFPALTVIAAHFGGWLIYDIALEYLKNETCYLDISSTFQLTGLKRGEELIRLYGARRLLFASDFPMWNPADCVNDFNKIDLTAEERDLILYKNALDILGER